MQVHLLGTAAFEGIPSLFCRCGLCKTARECGGKNIRSRTSVMIDNELKIDFPPDSFHHMIQYNLDYEEVQDLLLTHSHSDHLYAADLVARLPGYAAASDHPIHIYGNDVTLSKINTTFGTSGGLKEKYKLHLMRPFQRTVLQTAVVTPLPASHMLYETALLYYIEKDGKTLLYGHDSGRFPEETLLWLEQKKLDGVILECTMGNSDYDVLHMNVNAVLQTKQQLDATGTTTKNSTYVVTHFSHNANLTHEQLVDIFEPHHIRVAYDGMQLNL